MKNNTVMTIIGHIAINVIRIFSILIAFAVIEVPVLSIAWALGADDEIRAVIMIAFFLPMCKFAWMIYNVIIHLIIAYDKKNKRRGA